MQDLEQPIWPNDLAFQHLARKVADGVMWATRQGYRIGLERGGRCCCPLGSVLRMLDQSREPPSHPGAASFLRRIQEDAPEGAVLPDVQMVWAFVFAFENGTVSTSAIDAVHASADLGLAYRRRYLKRGSARRIR